MVLFSFFVFFFFGLMPNVNTVDCGQSRSSASLLPTVERSLPQLRGVGAAALHRAPPPPPNPTLSADTSVRPRPSSPPLPPRPHTHTPATTTSSLKWFKPLLQPRPLFLPITPPPRSLFLIYLFRDVFEVEAYFYLLELTPPPSLLMFPPSWYWEPRKKIPCTV